MPQNPPSKHTYLPQLEDKLQFLREGISEVEEQLRLRKEQEQALIDEIDQQICEVKSSIYALDYSGDMRNPPQMNQRRNHLEKEIKMLEKEKRQQELDCWRDITALQKDLRQLKKEYRAVKRSTGALCSAQKN